ncbi:MAG TPA: hypothetical protein VLL50_04470 [Usitatibacter sp.]|jgi:hypothetical protein|nr:hypothetical protein [Usitatibacter sp.]
MWARRVLLATMVAACAMSLPRHVPASWGFGATNASDATVASLR